jgi:ABC-2 type transport system ATP-binding protein
MANIIEVKDLKKSYNGSMAVNGLCLAIETGTCYGLLGPNGAGKTTTVEMMEKILEPDSGKILYKGGPRGEAFKQEMGIQLQQTELLSFLTVKETLKTFAAFYDRHLPVDQVMSMCMLESIQNKMNDKISGGQRQRLLLALALLNDPALVFLDEPTTGLDPQARQHVWRIIKDIKTQGKTIVLTTHYMEEAQVLCDILGIMDQGRIIETGTPERLVSRHCSDMGPENRNLETVFLKLTGKRLRE